MNIPELLNYFDDPEQKPILTPLLLEIGTLMLKIIYGKIDETDIDRAKVLVYNAGIEADWLNILSEGNPTYMDEVLNTVYTDICIGDTSLVIPNKLNQDEEILLGYNENDMPVYIDKTFNKEEKIYLAGEFGVEIDDDEFMEQGFGGPYYEGDLE